MFDILNYPLADILYVYACLCLGVLYVYVFYM